MESLGCAGMPALRRLKHCGFNCAKRVTAIRVRREGGPRGRAPSKALPRRRAVALACASSMAAASEQATHDAPRPAMRQLDRVQGRVLLERCARALLASIRLRLRSVCVAATPPKRLRVSILGAVAYRVTRREQGIASCSRATGRCVDLGHLVIRLRPCPGRAVSLLR